MCLNYILPIWLMTTKTKVAIMQIEISKVIRSLRKLQLSSEFRKALDNNFPITNNGNIELEKFDNNFDLVVNMLERVKIK